MKQGSNSFPELAIIVMVELAFLMVGPIILVQPLYNVVAQYDGICLTFGAICRSGRVGFCYSFLGRQNLGIGYD